MSQQLLSASEIFDAPDLTFHDEPVPEWPNRDGSPGVIRLVQLDAEAAMELTEEMTSVDRKKDGMFLMVVRCARTTEGTPLFTLEDIPRLKKKSMRVLNRLQRIALRLNAMDGASLKNDLREAVTAASPIASPKS